MFMKKLSNEEYGEFINIHKISLMLRGYGADDYLACRGCFLIGLLLQGFVLSEQALEKELKSTLLLLSPQEDLMKYKDHRLEKVINRIQDIKDYNLNSFLPLATKISDAYGLFRYPNNKIHSIVKEWSCNSSEINHIDEFYFFCNDINPMPLEFKFRNGIYPRIFEKKSEIKSWLFDKNIALSKRHSELQLINKEVEKLYIKQ